MLVGAKGRHPSPQPTPHSLPRTKPVQGGAGLDGVGRGWTGAGTCGAARGRCMGRCRGGAGRRVTWRARRVPDSSHSTVAARCTTAPGVQCSLGEPPRLAGPKRDTAPPRPHLPRLHHRPQVYARRPTPCLRASCASLSPAYHPPPLPPSGVWTPAACGVLVAVRNTETDGVMTHRAALAQARRPSGVTARNGVDEGG